VIPVLLLAYQNLDGVQNRITELRHLGASQIYVFLDGFESRGSVPFERTSLVRYLRSMNESGHITQLLEAPTNLGVGVAVPTALDWFFSNVQFGLILEDDCRLLPYFSAVIETLPEEILLSSLICFSNPRQEIDNLHLYFYESPFFSSWGWSCSKTIWSTNRVSTLSLKDVVSSVFSLSQVSAKRRLLLLVAWVDVWHSLRKDQNRLWAFRFSLNVIKNEQNVIYPSVKSIQHQPSGIGVNVKSNPSWDNVMPDEYTFERRLSAFELTSEISLNDYIASNVHGATLRSLFTRFAFKFYKMLNR